jgi:DNA-binding transcriptional LysR family regulator
MRFFDIKVVSMRIDSFKMRHLRMLVSLYDHQKIATVANLFGLSQPAMSRTLTEIEQMAGYQLFDRHNRGVRPTKLGQILVEHARKILSDFRRVEHEMSAAAAGKVGAVHFGTVMTPTTDFIVPTLTNLLSRTPGVQVEVTVDSTKALTAEVQKGTLDFAICRQPQDNAAQWMDFRPIGSEILSVVCSFEHPLLHRDVVSDLDLCSAPWILQGQGSPVRQLIDDIFARQELVLHDVISTSSVLMTLLTVMQSNRLGIFSQSVASMLETHGLVRVLALESNLEVSDFGLLSLRGRKLSLVAQMLANELEQNSLNHSDMR